MFALWPLRALTEPPVSLCHVLLYLEHFLFLGIRVLQAHLGFPLPQPLPPCCPPSLICLFVYFNANICFLFNHNTLLIGNEHYVVFICI